MKRFLKIHHQLFDGRHIRQVYEFSFNFKKGTCRVKRYQSNFIYSVSERIFYEEVKGDFEHENRNDTPKELYHYFFKNNASILGSAIIKSVKKSRFFYNNGTPKDSYYEI